MNTIYVIIGIIESISQTYIGGAFESSLYESVIGYTESRQAAKDFIASQRLPKAIKSTFVGTARYKNGYYDMRHEEAQHINTL